MCSMQYTFNPIITRNISRCWDFGGVVQFFIFYQTEVSFTLQNCDPFGELALSSILPHTVAPFATLRAQWRGPKNITLNEY